MTLIHRPIDKTTDISDKGIISDVDGTPIVLTTNISDKGFISDVEGNDLDSPPHR